MGLLRFTTLVLLTLLSLSSLTIAQSSFNFNCTLNTTCQALVGYVSPNTTSLSNIQTLFSVKNFHSLLGANNLPLSTPANHTINATQTVKVPIPCICIDNTGVSNKVPIYTVQQDDALYHIFYDLFSQLVDYETIAKMNKISDPNLIEVGQKIWIPLPCSCDEVKGEKVVHYADAVNEGSSLEEIVNEFGIPEETVMELIARAAMDSKFAMGVPIDIPLKACSSSIINDSEDSSLLVSNGTYLLTANQCVKCQCNSANNWTLQCEPSQLKPSNWSVCPSMQCGDFKTLYIGNTTMNGCDKTTCAYAGYSANQTIFTTLETTSTCPRNTSKSVMIAAIAASAVGIGVGVLMIIVCCFRRRFPSYEFILFGKKKPQKYQNVEAFLRNNAQLLSKRYSYSEVKKMTNSFRDKLGQGGYGGVYKGKLNDGSLVAVKVLNESKGNGEEFINEVASISRTSHVNIVTLLGFCFEGSKRALIYEFMPNGSLEKFIYENTHSKADRLLGWESLYQIAFGIAQGLEYLHRGCSTRILHFDIKPHNILLDEEFSPKISDFGLAKICPRKESIISMTGARGTAGYIAPELFCRNFGGVSHKSDVYSYGMMVLEMVGGRKNICVGVDRTSEIYFPQWICKHLELGEELELHGVRDEEEKKIARKMILVGLWCIQTDPSNRPPMSRVVEMLQGSVASLPIPPTPFLSSPPRTVENSLTASITTL